MTSDGKEKTDDMLAAIRAQTNQPNENASSAQVAVLHEYKQGNSLRNRRGRHGTS